MARNPRRVSLSEREARWLALEAQGLRDARPSGPVGARHVLGSLRRLGTIQLDAVNVLERTQFLVPFSRLGSYQQRDLLGLSGRDGRVFEYWGHAASLLPVEMHPLFRWRMQQRGGAFPGSATWQVRREAWRKENESYIAAVHDEVRERGPIPASKLSDPRRRDGEWWGRRSIGRVALEWLFGAGDLAAYRAANFERVYDVPERIIPRRVLDQPTPTVEEAQRALVADSARALGVATVADLADYYRLDQRTARARTEELVEAGTLTPVTVDGWAAPAYVTTGVRPRPPRRTEATLLSPFDSLIWFRARTARMFGVEYRIEIYVPAPKRTYGYYVLPLLFGDEIVARLDLKADRAASTLRTHAFHLEAGVTNSARADVIEAAAEELDRLRDWLGLEHAAVGSRSTAGRALATALRRVVGSGAGAGARTTPGVS